MAGKIFNISDANITIYITDIYKPFNVIICKLLKKELDSLLNNSFYLTKYTA